MTINTLGDFAGDGKVHNLCDLFQLPTQTMALMLAVREVSGGSAATRVGGYDVGPNNGIPLTVNDSFLLHLWGKSFPLNNMFIYTASGDTVAISVVL